MGMPFSGYSDVLVIQGSNNDLSRLPKWWDLMNLLVSGLRCRHKKSIFSLLNFFVATDIIEMN